VSASSTTKFLRTSIVLAGADGAVIDVQLPAESRVEDVTYDLVRYLHDELSAQGRPAGWLLDSDAVWTLERFGRRQLDNEQSLAEQNLLDGERIFLTKNARNETYPALIDDIAESVAKYQETFPEWKYDVDAVRFSAISLAVVGISLMLGAGFLASWALETDTALRWPIVGALAAIALVCTALAVPLVRGGENLLGTSLLSLGYAGIGVAAFSAVPREPGLWHLAVTSAALLLFAAIAAPLAPGPVRLHSGVMSAAAPVVLISIGNFFYLSPSYVIGAQVAMVAFILILMSSRIAMMAAKVETPYVPAAGEALTRDETSLGSVNRSSSSREVIESVINQKEQNYAAHQYLVGILAGTLTVIVGSAALSGFYVDDRRWYLFGFYIAVSMCLMYRARNDINRDVHSILLGASIATPFAYGIAMAVGDPYGNLWQIAATTAAIAVATLVGSLWALSQRLIKAPTVRRWFELVEFAMYSAPAVWLGLLMNVYMIARNR